MSTPQHSLSDYEAAMTTAAAVIAEKLSPTPLLHSTKLSNRLGCKVLLKMESLQPTGSFKIRGALNKCHQTLQARKPEDPQITFVAASSGNHALASCHCWRLFDCQGEVFIPETVSPLKEAKLLSLGFPVNKIKGQCLNAELEARRFAEASPSRVLMSPYNDWAVMTGNGTFAVELLTQMEAQGDRLDAVIVSVGGGSLIGGAGAFLKAKAPNVRVIGAQAQNDPVMSQSVKAGRLLTSEELNTTDTIAQAIAGAVEEGSVTFDPCRTFVDEWILCTEAEIARATLELLESDGLRVESSAGLTLAALRRCLPEMKGRTVALCVCGGNAGDAEWTEYERVAKED